MPTRFLRMKRLAGYAFLAFCAVVAALTVVHYPSQVDDVSSENSLLDRADYKSFYGANYYGIANFASAAPELAPTFGDHREVVREFVRRHGLQNGHVLEVGAGIGQLQDIVSDYVGLDIAAELARFYHKPFVAASATRMPFKDGEFDAIWTFGTLQSVPKPEQALSE